jgi:hypothetical protein
MRAACCELGGAGVVREKMPDSPECRACRHLSRLRIPKRQQAARSPRETSSWRDRAEASAGKSRAGRGKPNNRAPPWDCPSRGKIARLKCAVFRMRERSCRSCRVLFFSIQHSATARESLGIVTDCRDLKLEIGLIGADLDEEFGGQRISREGREGDFDGFVVTVRDGSAFGCTGVLGPGGQIFGEPDRVGQVGAE